KKRKENRHLPFWSKSWKNLLTCGPVDSLRPVTLRKTHTLPLVQIVYLCATVLSLTQRCSLGQIKESVPRAGSRA
ncbi:uncharacterized protein PgNI_01540, partial [Pyricularia grisea]|uniref:Uncharacterized protein n=1 Tax=Pyricularia grisea TaxID=148305 RepID=A0A6P8BLF9_PYRGI